jgi:hypothetical protein
MNLQAIRILFLKDLFLSRRHLFAYFVAGLLASALACTSNTTLAYVGFVLVLTVAIAAGIHLIGTLLLAETTEQTKLFVMSFPISLLDYSIGKISVVLTTYLIPWTAMFSCLVVATFVMGKQGNVIVLPAIFFFLLCGFMIQMLTAVVSDSIGWTICVMVGCNVGLNIFLMKLFGNPEIAEVVKSDVLSWPAIVLQIIAVELLLIVVSLVIAFWFQTRKRDLI